MRYYTVKQKKVGLGLFGTSKKQKQEQQEKQSKLTELDKSILKKCGELGSDISGIISSSKPYVTSDGIKMFATTKDIVSAVHKLVGLKMLRKA